MNWETIIIILITSFCTIIGALIGAIIAPFLNHRYSLERLEKEHKKKIDYMKEEWKFSWKIKNFDKINKELSRKINFYEKIKDKLLWEISKKDRPINKKELIKEIDREKIQNKIKDDDFYIFCRFDKNILNINTDFTFKEVNIGILIKEYFKKKEEKKLIEISAEISNLNILKNRLTKEMSKQIL